MADVLGLEPGVVAAVLAAQAGRRGLNRQGRLNIRFENHVFYDRWGKKNEDLFRQHFNFDPHQPWRKHQWRAGAGEAWRNCHTNQDEEWSAFALALSLDETAAKLASGMGLARMMGFSYAASGFESVEQMFDAFSSGERYQIFALFDLIAGPEGRSRQLAALREDDLDLFAALHYGFPEHNQYAYMLEGLESEWNYVGPSC